MPLSKPLQSRYIKYEQSEGGRRLECSIPAVKSDRPTATEATDQRAPRAKIGISPHFTSPSVRPTTDVM